MRIVRSSLPVALLVSALGCSLLAPPDRETVGTRPGGGSSGAAGMTAGDAGATAAGEGGALDDPDGPVDVGTPSGPWAVPDGALLTSWGSNVRPSEALREYPRPQLVRRAWATLNGLWDYALRSKVDSQPSAWDGKILVPFAVESALSGVSTRLTAQGQLWYRRTFELPPAWRGKRLLLHFGAVDYAAHVFVNGTAVGEHLGGYDAFDFDVTEQLVDGQTQEVVVAVTDPSDGGGQPRGKQSASPKLGSVTQVSGIWQSVWLEPVADTYIESLELTPSAADGTVSVKANLAGSPNASTVLSVTVNDGNTAVASAQGSASAALTLAIDEPKIWSPATPTLYDLTITLSDDSGAIDTARSYVGLRDVALRADSAGIRRIFLNDEALFQLGVVDQGNWPDGLYTAPSDEALRTDLSRAKQLGFVALRKHQKVEPDRFYYWCDKLGLLVWQDMPTASNDTDADRSQFEAELGALVTQHRNHPSIVAWDLFYFGGGQFEPARLTDSVKALDPTRLVDAVTGFPDDGSGDVRDRPDFARVSSPEPGTRAVVIGAFGNLSQGVDGHVWDAKASFDYDAASAVPLATKSYEELVSTAWGLNDARGLSAAMFRQLTDVENELDGLFTYDRALLKFDSKRLPESNAGHLDPVYTLLETSDMTADPAFGTGGASSYAAERHRYRMTLAEPPAGWEQPDFDDSSWTEAPAGFGFGTVPAGAPVSTPWPSGNIWIRTDFDYSGPLSGSAYVRLLYSGDVWAYVNGRVGTSRVGANTKYEDFLVGDAAQRSLRVGKNTLAARCVNRNNNPFVDLGLVQRADAPVLLDAAKAGTTAAGAIFARYDGNWTTLPTFNTLTPAALGESATLSLAAAAPATANYALQFTGYVEVPQDGVFTFFLKADDNAQLAIDGKPIVSVTGRTDLEYTGNIGLKAGKHALSLGYLQINQVATLQVSWVGPGLVRQVIPAEALSHAVEPADSAPGAVAGAAFSQYNGTFLVIPDFSKLTPNVSGTSSTLTYGAANVTTYFALKFTGYIDVQKAGVYSFLLSADDGAKLWLGDNVVSTEGRPSLSVVSGNLALAAGKHAFTLGHIQRGAGAALDLSWIGPGITKQTLPAAVLFH